MINPTFATRNLIKSADPIGSKIFGLYYTHNSIFDVLLDSIDSLCLIKTSKKHQLIDQIHMQPILLMNNELPSMFKKEDRYLLSEALKDASICCMTTDLYDKSVRDKSALIHYGFPEIDINQNQRKSVLVINTKNNPRITAIYSKIKEFHEDAKIITSFSDMSLIEALDIFNEYSIVLAIDNHVDILFALSCGCSCVTNLEIDNTGITKVVNFQNIISIVNQAVATYGITDRAKIAKDIQKQYPIEKFKEEMILFIGNSIRKKT
jgi:hypothetical protein